MEFPPNSIGFAPAGFHLDPPLIINQTAEVSLKIARQVLLGKLGKGKNLVLSPLSLQVMLSLIASGAEGATLDQLLSFLKSSSTDESNSLYAELVSVVFADGSASGGPQLSFASGAWVDQTFPLKPSFKQVVETVYKAESFQVYFQTQAGEVLAHVNSWAEKKTNGLIKNVLDNFDSDTQLILANTLYFKGIWTEKFDSSKTKDYDFHLLDGNLVKVPFMISKKKQFVSKFDGFKTLKLPYNQGDDKRKFSMCIFLPDAKDGLTSLIEQVGSQIGFIDRYLATYKVELRDFRVPKFKFSFGFEANKSLKALGVSLPFQPGGLTEMTESPIGKKLYVSTIKQKSFIEFNEEGTEAAAVNVATFAMQCLCTPSLDFVADHPFLFFIREDTSGNILFVGCVMNPLESE